MCLAWAAIEASARRVMSSTGLTQNSRPDPMRLMRLTGWRGYGSLVSFREGGLPDQARSDPRMFSRCHRPDTFKRPPCSLLALLPAAGQPRADALQATIGPGSAGHPGPTALTARDDACVARHHPCPDRRAQHAPPCTCSASARCALDLPIPSRRCARRVQHTLLLRPVRCVIPMRKDARGHPGILDARVTLISLFVGLIYD